MERYFQTSNFLVKISAMDRVEKGYDINQPYISYYLRGNNTEFKVIYDSVGQRNEDYNKIIHEIKEMGQ